MVQERVHSKILGCFLLPSVGEACIGGYSVTGSHKSWAAYGYLNAPRFIRR